MIHRDSISEALSHVLARSHVSRGTQATQSVGRKRPEHMALISSRLVG